MKHLPAVLILLAGIAMFPCAMRAQNISDIAKSDPLIITGAVGTQNTYNYSSTGDGYGSPLSNTIYANLNISLYGISMPFSLYYSNDNVNFSYPHFTLSLTPTYKGWTGHLGQSTMEYSPYVMNTSWNGVGLEYNEDRWHVGAFYGRLRKAINDDPTDPAARKPQFRRMGWGFKAGYGTKTNYIDIYFLRAYDCLNSVSDPWHEIISPQENIVVGIKGCVTPVKWASLSANAATSIFSTDTRAGLIEDEKAKQWDKVFDVRYSSLMRFAGDVTLNLSMPFGLNTSISYRMVQPDYTSLGTHYMSNNYQSLGITASTILFKRISLTGTFSGQKDNLTKQQMFTTAGYVYNAHANARLGEHFNISAGYNGYTQRQGDGTCRVNDTTRVDRRMNSFSLTPSYMTETEKTGHSVSLSLNYTNNKDRNEYTNNLYHSDINTRALGLSYGLNVKPWNMDFDLSLSHQETRGYNTKYKSQIATLGANRAFLDEKNLNVNAAVNLCYNEIYRQSKSLSMGGNIGLSYTHNKVHSLSAAASFNKYGDVNMVKTRSNLDCTDISCSLNYVYTFTLLEIKRKK